MTKRTAFGLFFAALLGASLTALVVAPSALAAVYSDFSEFRLIRHTNLRGPSAYTASADLNKSVLQSYQFFKVDTQGGAVDLDFGDDAAMDAADIGSEWLFCVGLGGTNALTVTAGASGVTTVNSGVVLDGSTCEDVGDCIRVILYSTTAATAIPMCAD